MNKSFAVVLTLSVLAVSAFAVEERATPMPEGMKGGLVFTFDDGTVDQYEIAAPVLEKYGMRAIFNIIPSRIGNPGFMTWDQVADLVKRGHELGNHTWSHPNLNRLASTGGVERVEWEICHARDVLKEKTGFDPITLCYPYNANGPVAEKIVKEKGLRNICYRMSNWGGSFAGPEARAAAEKSMASGRVDYILMHGLRPGGGWAPLNKPEQFEDIVRTLKSIEGLWLPGYSESVDWREGNRRYKERVKWEREQLDRYARMAFRCEVTTKGGWQAERKCGEQVEFAVSFRPYNEKVAKLVEGKPVKIVLDNFGSTVIAEAETVLSTNGVTKVAGTLNEPGFLRLQVKVDSLNPNFGNNWQRAVPFEPKMIKTAGDCPQDFESFWQQAVEKAGTVPLDPQIKLNEKKSQKDHDFYEVSVATVNNRRVHGYLLVPKKREGTVPLRVQVPGAGIGGWSLWPHPLKDEALLFITVFPWAPSDDTGDQGKRFNAMLGEFRQKYGYGHYYMAGLCDSREDHFYYPVILGASRMVDLVAAREEIDASRVTYYGISQGGGFGLYLSLVNKTISRFVVNVPAFSDLTCDTEGRQTCTALNLWKYDDPARLEAARRFAPYFDTANFAKKMTKPIRFVTGEQDWVCPPATVYAAYNGCASTDKEIWLNGGDHNTSPEEAQGRANRFLRGE